MNIQPMQLKSERAGKSSFDHVMVGLASVLFITVVTAGSILVTLPEALEKVATPAFGAPWITASVSSAQAAVVAKDRIAPGACGAN